MHSSFENEISFRLRSYMLWYGYTQKEMAQDIHVRVSTINQLLNGKSISRKALEKISDYLCSEQSSDSPPDDEDLSTIEKILSNMSYSDRHYCIHRMEAFLRQFQKSLEEIATK